MIAAMHVSLSISRIQSSISSSSSSVAAANVGGSYAMRLREFQRPAAARRGFFVQWFPLKPEFTSVAL